MTADPLLPDTLLPDVCGDALNWCRTAAGTLALPLLLSDEARLLRIASPTIFPSTLILALQPEPLVAAICWGEPSAVSRPVVVCRVLAGLLARSEATAAAAAAEPASRTSSFDVGDDSTQPMARCFRAAPEVRQKKKWCRVPYMYTQSYALFGKGGRSLG
jgi:hypothetical protein